MERDRILNTPTTTVSLALDTSAIVLVRSHSHLLMSCTPMPMRFAANTGGRKHSLQLHLSNLRTFQAKSNVGALIQDS